MIPTSPASGMPTTRVGFQIFDGSYSLISSLVSIKCFAFHLGSGKDLVRIRGVFCLRCYSVRPFEKSRGKPRSGSDGQLTSYVAMLRGINVSGQKIVKMERLRASFGALGFSRVRTYVQSGNVIFEAPNDSPDSLSGKIKEMILSDYGFSVPVILRTSAEMKKIAGDNPFLTERGIDHSGLHVTFLSELPEKAALGKLDSLNGDPDQFRIRNREVYLYCPNGYGRSKLSNSAFEKLLSVEATTRNWKTVNMLVEMSSV